MAEERYETEPDDLAARAAQDYKASKDHTSGWRNDAEEAFDMEAGTQWKTEEVTHMQEQQRPLVTFNRIARTINAILGTQVANRQETRFIPREMGDVQVNEVLTAAAEWVRDNTDAEDEESDAFADMCISGMGWTETRMDYSSDPDGDIRIDRIDPLEMHWDPSATKRNLADARWVMHVKVMPLSEFRREWPDADMDSAGAIWDEGDDPTQRTHVYPQDAYNDQQRGGTKKQKMVRVAHYQWAEPVTSYRVGANAERMDEDAFEKLRPKMEQDGVKYVKQKGVVWKRAFIAGNTVLEEGDCPFPDGPTFRCMTYKRDRNKNLWYGVVKAMIDPQRFGNKFFSQILDILNKGAKGGIIAEKDAFDDPRDAEQKWARPDGIVWARSGALAQGKIQPKPIVNLPAGLDKLMQFSMDAVHEVTGVNLELLGFADREQAGVLEHQRKQAGLTIIAPLFDAMRKYRKEQGRVMLHFIQEYISDGRLVRIMGQNGNEQYVPIAKQPDSAKYDVIVDESPTSPNMKERTFSILVELLPTLMKGGIPIPPEVIDYAPLPSTLQQKWKEQLQNSIGDPEQIKKQMEDMGQQVQKLTQENQQLKDKRQQTAAELQLKQAEAEAEAQLAREKAEAELALKRAELEAEIELERMKLGQELQLRQAEFQQQSQLKSQEMEMKTRQVDFDNDLALEKAAGADGKGMGGIGKRMDSMQKLLDQLMSQPKAKRITVRRNAEGLLEGADIE